MTLNIFYLLINEQEEYFENTGSLNFGDKRVWAYFYVQIVQVIIQIVRFCPKNSVLNNDKTWSEIYCTVSGQSDNCVNDTTSCLNICVQKL